jgi:copper homeostasis protein
VANLNRISNNRLDLVAKGTVAAMTAIEICVESLESALAAEQGGAQRIELCSALSEGGLTPSLGLIRAVRRGVKIGVHVMIRPRAGDFLYSEDELGVMRQDIRVAGEEGADGVVLGLLTEDSDVDVGRTRELVELARPMDVTFHRAFDRSRQLEASLEEVMGTGAVRVLTSGGEVSAILGATCLRQLVAKAGGRIEIMVGGGVLPQNIGAIADSMDLGGGSPLRKVAFHASLRRSLPSRVRDQGRDGGMGDADDYARSGVLVEDVVALQEALDHALQGN